VLVLVEVDLQPVEAVQVGLDVVIQVQHPGHLGGALDQFPRVLRIADMAYFSVAFITAATWSWSSLSAARTSITASPSTSYSMSAAAWSPLPLRMFFMYRNAIPGSIL